MALYLDIDLDYFVAPVLKESVTNQRPPDPSHCRLANPADLFSVLQEKGVRLGHKRFIFTNHMQSHLRWWIHGKKNNRVIHIDAHSDLYGHHQPDLSSLEKLGCQNYLWHAIRENLVSEIYWVFPDRLFDPEDPSILKKMFLPCQLGRSFTRDRILHTEILCSLPGQPGKVIPYHLLQLKDLPVFQETAEIITVATSPEFLPRQADTLLPCIEQLLHFEPGIMDKLRQTHEEMK